MIKKIADGAFFVVDSTSYKSRITEYDPLLANSTLHGSWEDEDSGLVVADQPVFFDESTTVGCAFMSNDELRKLAARHPAPAKWLQGEEESLF